MGLALAIGGFAGAASAQDTTTTPKQDKVEKNEKFERRGDIGRHGDGEGFRGPGKGGPEGLLRGLRELNLTDAQKQQIHTILESNKPDQANFDEMKTLMEAKRGGTITAEQQDRLKTLRQQGREKMESVHKQVLDVLTAEQRQQLEAKQKERREQMEQRRDQWKKDKPATDKPAVSKPTNN